MQKFLYYIRYAQLLFNNGLFQELLKSIFGKLFGKVIYVCLKLEVDSFISPGLSRMILFERPIKEDDYAILTSMLMDKTLHRNERHEVIRRLAMLETELKTCYVVEDANHNLRFIQWLIPASENEKLQMLFGDWYPKLDKNEGLMEAVYVFPKYRGTGILVYAVKKIVNIASQLMIKQIQAIIPIWNLTSLVSFMKMGFKPYAIRIEKKCFGFKRRRTIPFTSISDMREIVMSIPHQAASLLFKS